VIGGPVQCECLQRWANWGRVGTVWLRVSNGKWTFPLARSAAVGPTGNPPPSPGPRGSLRRRRPARGAGSTGRVWDRATTRPSGSAATSGPKHTDGCCTRSIPQIAALPGKVLSRRRAKRWSTDPESTPEASVVRLTRRWLVLPWLFGRGGKRSNGTGLIPRASVVRRARLWLFHGLGSCRTSR
jgi:hypothetical protein